MCILIRSAVLYWKSSLSAQRKKCILEARCIRVHLRLPAPFLRLLRTVSNRTLSLGFQLIYRNSDFLTIFLAQLRHLSLLHHMANQVHVLDPIHRRYRLLMKSQATQVLVAERLGIRGNRSRKMDVSAEWSLIFITTTCSRRLDAEDLPWALAAERQLVVISCELLQALNEK